MPSNKKLLQAAAGNAGESLYVEDVFSTFLYAGNGAYQTITNGIDLLNEGGLVWGKSRTTSGRDNYLWDTERGYSGSSNFTGNTFSTNTTTAEQSGEHVRNIYEDGYQSWGGYHINMSGQDYVSWTFRKAKKFFDIVTWTGDGSTKTHNHNLGSTPAAIIVKRTDSTSPWSMYHKDATDTVRSGEDLMLYLNTTAAAAYLGSTLWAATDSTFTTTGGGNFNASGGTYVAYLFASDAGGFGDDGTENIIKCGSYTGNASTDGPEINLGFEPQWVYAKRTDSGGTHGILDVMRGMPVGGTDGDLILFPNTSDAEINQINLAPTPTGFKLEDDGTFLNQSGATYIYIAIRRPMKTPESGTEVFDTILRTGTGSNATITGMGFTPDLAITKIRTIDYPQWAARLTNNKFLKSSTSDAEATGDLQSNAWDVQEGLNVVTGGFNSNGDSFANWFFRRATGFMDVVAYPSP